MSPSPGKPRHASPRFPRVSGDEPFEDIPLSREEMFSPRERG